MYIVISSQKTFISYYYILKYIFFLPVLKAFPTYLTDEWFEVAVHVHVTLEDNLNRVMESDE